MGHHILPTEFIHYSKMEKHEELKAELLEHVYSSIDSTVGDQIGKWRSTVNTEYFKNQESEGVFMSLGTGVYARLLEEGIWPAVDQLFKDIPNLSIPTRSTLQEIWYNYYTPGQYQEVHTHHEYTISGVYFLSLEEVNGTVFHSYTADRSALVPAVVPTTMIREGDILLFPSAFLHYVLPASSNRVTIAFNIKCDF